MDGNAAEGVNSLQGGLNRDGAAGRSWRDGRAARGGQCWGV